MDLKVALSTYCASSGSVSHIFIYNAKVLSENTTMNSVANYLIMLLYQTFS